MFNFPSLILILKQATMTTLAMHLGTTVREFTIIMLREHFEGDVLGRIGGMSLWYLFPFRADRQKKAAELPHALDNNGMHQGWKRHENVRKHRYIGSFGRRPEFDTV